MSPKLKIKVSACVCAAFVLRLALINFSFLFSIQTLSAAQLEPQAFLKDSKISSEFKSTQASENADFLAEEISEEDLDEEDPFKFNSLPQAQLASCVAGLHLTPCVKQPFTFNQRFSQGSSSRYLEFRVFRI